MWKQIYSRFSEGLTRIRRTNVVESVKKAYEVVREELNTTPAQRRAKEEASKVKPTTTARSDRTELVIVPRKVTEWEKRWGFLRDKLFSHPVFARFRRLTSHPVVTKGQEMAEVMRERWETSDSPVVHKIQDINESIFGETAPAMAVKEIKKRDPHFSFPDFLAEVQNDVRPLLTAYLKGDFDILRFKCRKEAVERCEAERRAVKQQGWIVDYKLLHISEAEIRETKLVGSDPVIIVSFQTQQVYCARDSFGNVVDGGSDEILSVFYAWAMQLSSAEELAADPRTPKWKLREMQQMGMQTLI